jgi:hypothetical protein
MYPVVSIQSERDVVAPIITIAKPFSICVHHVKQTKVETRLKDLEGLVSELTKRGRVRESECPR